MSLGLADPPLRASSSCRRETDWGVYYWCAIYSDTSVFQRPVVSPLGVSTLMFLI